VSQLGYRHLRPVTPPASTSGETSPASQVLPKGPGSRGFVGALLSIEPWVCPCANSRLIWKYPILVRKGLILEKKNWQENHHMREKVARARKSSM
jgi:hypothetical protein